MRAGTPKGFFYLDLRTVDGRHHVIINDTHVTTAKSKYPYEPEADGYRRPQCQRLF